MIETVLPPPSPVLCIVIPCYNEEAVLPVTAPLFLQELETLIQKKKISEKSFVLFSNDGSKDKTWQIIQNLSKENKAFRGISLSRNRGHQNALLAGLMNAKEICDITISIDCDGQDDISAMESMVDEYLNKAEIVYGVRNNRDSDTFFKRFTAQSFYRLLNWMTGGGIIYNHADYRLVSSRALQEFAKFKEVNLFLRGMFPMVGFKSTCVYYSRHERLAGKSHYPLKKMLALAFDGITSLSIKPIRLITGLGGLVMLASVAGIIYAVVQRILGNAVAGWASTTSIVCFLGGIQLLSLGIIGEYIGKIYLEVKGRPRFIVSEKTENLKGLSKGEK